MVRLTVLTNEEVEAIHQATLRILSEVGILLAQPRALEVLTEAGATMWGERVLLSPDLVEWAVAQCPSQVTIRGRGGKTVMLGDGSLHWHNLGGARDIYDPRTGQRRPATVQDVHDSARLLDALDSVTTITPFFTPQDVPGPLMSLAMYRHTLPHTTKPVQGPGAQTAAEVRYVARMAAVIGPPAEVLTLGISPVSPLFFPDDVAEAMLETARLGIPLGPLPCPIAGATAPMSLAGSLAQQNAEVLASVVLAQSVRPGLPIIYCGRLAMMEPRTGISVWGGVELGLASAATVQIAHRYGLPVNVYGLSTNGHVMDLQNGYERALNAIVPALAGADELSGIGEMDAGVASSYAQMVCDNEIAANVHRLLRGFAADEEALAVEVIAAVMDGPRNFLGQQHTVRYLRAGEILHTRLSDRRTWEEWDRAGRDGIAERAQAEVEQLLAEHEVPPLTEEQKRELQEILWEAERELAQS
ncbi:MAG: trimethylamine methyltransferase family protein [Chloroflexota bacterium]|nr:trimethylamine methyltransferase family protein [Chloroflexota bacterium]